MSKVNVTDYKKRLTKEIDEILNDLINNKGYSEEKASKIVENRIPQIKKILNDKLLEEAKVRHDEFDYDFIRVYYNEPFLGAVSMGITKEITLNMPTAYVGIVPHDNDYTVKMGINPIFFRSLNDEQKSGVIIHELYHVVFQHIFSRMTADKNLQRLQNWATDLAINSIIEENPKAELPEFALIPGKASIDPNTGEPIKNVYADFILNAPKLQSSDYYFEELKKIMEEEGNDSVDVAVQAGVGSMDDHENWGKLPEEIQDQLRNKMKDILRNATRRADRENNWGSVPQEIAEHIRRIVSNEVDWRRILHNFIGRVRSLERNSTIKRINKKMPYIHPGVVRKYIANFVIFLDQSGSVSDQDVALFYAELNNLAKETEIDTYHFDTEVDEKSYKKWKKGGAKPKAERTRCGGTNFQCVADFCNKKGNKNKYSGVIILTDGYAPKMGGIPGAKVLWVITEDGTTEHLREGDLFCQIKKTKDFKKY